MRRKHHGCLVAVLALTMGMMMGCGSDKYADAKSLMKDQTDIAEQYVNGLEKADNAGEVAEVINTYTDSMKALIPRIKDFREKFPDLSSNPDATGTPDDVKEEMKRLKEAMGKIQSATMKLMKYMMDSKVQEAFKRMGKELEQLGQP